MWFDQAILYQIYPWACAAHRRRTTGALPAASLRLLDWGGAYQAAGADAVLLNPVFDSDRHGYDTRDYNRLDPAWGPTRTWPRCAAPFTTPGSGSCWTGCSTMWAGASGPFGTFRRSGAAPIGTGSI